MRLHLGHSGLRSNKPLLALLVVGIVSLLGVTTLLLSQASELSSKGDINNDNQVNLTDLSILLTHFTGVGTAADLNKDGRVTVLDLSILLSNFGSKVVPSHYDPNKPYTIIMIGWQNYETQYAQLENSKVNLTYRSIENTPEGNARDLTLWDATGYKYYNNVAGSDWVHGSGITGRCANINNMYMNQTYAQELVQRKGSLGYYMHELTSFSAACNGWNWPNAVESLQWSTLDQYVAKARAQNKKIIWSEPAGGWQAIMASGTGNYYMSNWRDVVIPTFANNFREHLEIARNGTVQASQRFGTPLGYSMQSWYYYCNQPDGSSKQCVPFTNPKVADLADYGYNAGARYTQIEGTPGDMQWPAGKPSVYMQGILEFSKRLEQR